MFTYIANELGVLLRQNNLRCVGHWMVLHLVNVLPVVLLHSHENILFQLMNGSLYEYIF